MYLSTAWRAVAVNGAVLSNYQQPLYKRHTHTFAAFRRTSHVNTCLAILLLYHQLGSFRNSHNFFRPLGNFISKICILFTFAIACTAVYNLYTAYEMKNQQMSLFQFYPYIDGSLHVSGLQAHPQENSHSCSHNYWLLALQ
jgi:hypothetical protein